MFQDVFLDGRQNAQFLRCVASHESGVVEAVEEGRTDFELLLHQHNCDFLVNRRLPLTAAIGVVSQCLLQFVGQHQIIDN